MVVPSKERMRALVSMPPVGTVMILASGGWFSNHYACGYDPTRPGIPGRGNFDNGPAGSGDYVEYAHNFGINTAYQQVTRLSEFFRDENWRPVTVGFDEGYPCARQDAVDWYEYLNQRFSGPVCMFGGSAGANLALLVAAEKNNACVMGEGAPLQLATMPMDALVAGNLVHKTMDSTSMGPFAWSDWSPYGQGQNAYDGDKLLLGQLLTDPLVPSEQLSRFKLRYEIPTQAHYVAGAGACFFTHALKVLGEGTANCTQVEQFREKQRALLASF